MTTDAGAALVSVVMIFRDAEEFFDAAIDSVLAQTHPAVELLLCDDGSSDGSTALAMARTASHPDRVRYLDHPGHAHRGMSSTRNLGLAAARGDLVAFLDADDFWEPDHLSHEVGLLLEHPEAALVCGQAVDWYSWDGSGAVDHPSPLPWPPGVVVPPPQMLTAVLHRGAFRTPICNLLVRADALREVGGSEHQFPAAYEDQVLLAKLYLNRSCVISGSRTARYRRHSRSNTALAVASGQYDPFLPNPSREAFLRWLHGNLSAEGDHSHDELKTLVGVALTPYDGSPASRHARLRAAVPPTVRRVVKGVVRRSRAIGPVRMGSLRRVTPLSRDFGFDRGLPVDRYYVETFLAENAHLVSGRVLEVGDNDYTQRFGSGRVISSDVLNIDPDIPGTTIVADLATGDAIPSASFDCLVITQTLHFVYDLAAAVRTLRRILSPGGTLLATFPGISQVSRDRWAESWCWALTPVSAARLFGEAFGPANVEVRAFGNVLASVAFLEGMAACELHRAELDVVDPQYPMLVTVRAFRPLGGTDPA